MGTDIHGVWQKKTPGGWQDVPSAYMQDRHYRLFALLAGVRNGIGFAGVVTHEPVTPISEPRGLPNDFACDDSSNHPIESIEIIDPRRREHHHADNPQCIWMGDHSHSWLTWDEILNFQLPKKTCTGIVCLVDYRAWDGVSRPYKYAGSVSGQTVVVSGPHDITYKTTHVRIEWVEDWGDSIRDFLDEVRRLKELHGAGRFVFGFDS